MKSNEAFWRKKSVFTEKQKTIGLFNWCCSDGPVLYILSPKDKHFELSTIDSKSFVSVGRIKISYPYNPIAEPIIDEDIIFVPSVDGRIIGIDKFSNEHVVDIDLGSMMASRKSVCDANSIYTICSIPISNRKTTDTDISVICVNDKLTGKKKAQSCVLKGNMSPLLVSDFIWGSHNKEIKRFSLLGELEKVAKLSFVQSFPVLLPDFLLSFSESGGIEIFDLDLRPHMKLMVQKTKCPPVVSGELVYWATNGQVVQLTSDWKVEKLSDFPFVPISSVFLRGHLFVSTEEGVLVDLDVDKRTISSIYLDKKMRYLQISGNHILVASDRELFQICPNT